MNLRLQRRKFRQQPGNAGDTNNAGVSIDGDKQQYRKNHGPMAASVGRIWRRIDVRLVGPADMVSIALAAIGVSRYAAAISASATR